MAALIAQATERRTERRCAGAGSRWQRHAVLRPGQPIVVVDISHRAALVESAGRLRPGSRTEMQLTVYGTRVSVKGHLERCSVTSLAPLRYRGLLVFDQRLEDLDDEM